MQQISFLRGKIIHRKVEEVDSLHACYEVCLQLPVLVHVIAVRNEPTTFECRLPE